MVGSRYDIIVDKNFKFVIGGVSVVFGGSVDRGFEICVSNGVGSADGIKFGIDNGADMVSSDVFFEGLSYFKHVCLLIDESLE